ncbi:MAG: anaerobic ribonucleoside-triphosphate reductase, partial [Bacteroidales bacterium]|nr:anaerobic ribonucleoside-triphosphate reductase [Bacteroidales bacterium]
HLSKYQYIKLIDFAIAQGTSYFTFNVPNSDCTNEACHHIVKAPLEVCPKCGAPMRQWTRVIGFLRPIDDFDKYRNIEAKTRYYAKEVK